MEKVNIPEGISGNWKVEKFTVSKDDAKWSALRDGYRSVSAGDYTRLMHGSEVIMSDTPAEESDHYQPVLCAKSHILINGLGLGMVLLNCLLQDSVTKATVIEKSEDVINLVSPTYHRMFGDKVEIVHADAFEYSPPKEVRYGMVWHDIWTYICADNLEEMKRLHRKYGKKTDWQGSWCRRECELAKKRDY